MISLLSAAMPHPVRNSHPPESCIVDFDRLARKVEQDYAGFQLEIHGARREAYDRERARLRLIAAATRSDACYFVFRDLIAFFQDPHLFIFQSTRVTAAETARRARVAGRMPLTESQARAYFVKNSGRLDPLEGLWYDRGLRVAVVPAPEHRNGELVAVVLTTDTSTWLPGTIRARFTPRKDGGYSGVVYERNYAVRYVDARIHKRVLLRLSPGMWGKEFPVTTADSGYLAPEDARRPTLVARTGTLVVSIPSHDPAFRPWLDSLVAANRAVLAATPRLIVDLRGNEGGSSSTARSLVPFVASDSERPPPLPEGEPMLLSSADEIGYVRRHFAGGGVPTASVRRLLARLAANPGQLVPLRDSLDSREAPRRRPVVAGARRVGFLVDGGTVSAGEAFLVQAMRSTRVTVFGLPTAGALDYQTAYIVPFQLHDRRWFLGYPTITARPDLPRDGIRGTGLKPEVRLELDSEPDPIGRVERMLSAGH
ncbi:MAG: S41 family peptidase [Gemmatimonadota bacterium]